MKRTIKKYKNRKLYDTEESRYISLSELSEILRRGIDIVVVDQKTNVDVTGTTLAQAILGDEKALYSPLVIEAFKEIIRDGDIHTYFKRKRLV